MSPAVEKELCFAKFQDTFVQSFLHRDDVIPPVPPTSLEEGGDGSAEQKMCEMMTDPRVCKTFLPKQLQKPWALSKNYFGIVGEQGTSRM